MHRLVLLCLFIFFAISAGVRADPIPELIGTLWEDTTRTFYGFQILGMGDQNSDGYDDILVWGGTDKANNLYFGGNPLDETPALRFDSTRERTLAADVNRDGYLDLITAKHPTERENMGVYFGGPLLDTIRDLNFGVDSIPMYPYSVYTDDLNRDGNAEIIVPDLGWDFLVVFELGDDCDSIPDYIIPPHRDVPPGTLSGPSFGEALATGDFNGDGLPDLAVSLRESEGLHINGTVHFYFGGPDFDTIPDFIISHPGPWVRGNDNFGALLTNIGDFNGDGYDDVFTGSGVALDDTVNYIYYTGPAMDTVPDITVFTRLHHASAAGDINKDSYPDLIVSFSLSFSTGGAVYIFYGGPDADSLPDVTILNSDISSYETEFGMDCAGVGDVNGDNVDDFAFSALNNQGRGKVFIYSGTGVPVSVDDDPDLNLPRTFTLSQNYPNPFNATTTISFHVPRKSEVDLIVYDLLGRCIRTLVQQTVSAGNHAVGWDGTDSEGSAVASGVYVYRLRVDHKVMSRKMVLLK